MAPDTALNTNSTALNRRCSTPPLVALVPAIRTMRPFAGGFPGTSTSMTSPWRCPQPSSCAFWAWSAHRTSTSSRASGGPQGTEVSTVAVARRVLLSLWAGRDVDDSGHNAATAAPTPTSPTTTRISTHRTGLRRAATP